MKTVTPEQNIVATLAGKKVLFLENDNDFTDYGGQNEFVDILKRNNIEYKALFNLDEDYTFEEITKEIMEYDVICFMTQWVYDISHRLRDFMFALAVPKYVIEIYIKEPTFYYQPEDTVHQVYIYTSQVTWGEVDKESERFYKLSRKPYWDYKNKFDK